MVDNVAPKKRPVGRPRTRPVKDKSSIQPRGNSVGNTRGAGRRKGAQNLFTVDVKNMILEALKDAGGVAYLVRQAKKNPSVFMGLVGKLVPRQVNSDVNISGRIDFSAMTDEDLQREIKNLDEIIEPAAKISPGKQAAVS